MAESEERESMRLFTATIATETNTFSPLPTSIEAYKEGVFLRPGEHPDETPLMCTAPLYVARNRAKAEGFTLIEGSCFAASPAGTTNRADYEFMRDEILEQLEAALPVDGVLLGLHGAMVAHGYEDVLDIVLKTLRGKAKPVMSLYDCRQIQSYPTTLPLMRGFVDRMKAMEGKDGVLSISIGHCFPYADVPELGGRILVVMDKDKAKGDALATKIGEEFVAMRGKTMPEYLSTDEGISTALEFNDQPVVLADPADNAGGGAPSDNTTILRRLIEREAREAVVGPLWDPIAVRLCFDAGLGAEFPLRFGGKIGPTSGAPIDAKVTVVGLKRDCWQSFGPTQVPLGDCAAVRIGGVEVVLISNRTQALGLELFTNLGIDPRMKKIVVVKSTNHFMAAFGPIAKKVIYIDSDGPLSRDYRKIPYTKVARPIWPLDESTRPSLIF